jgi:hypothetical protein
MSKEKMMTTAAEKSIRGFKQERTRNDTNEATRLLKGNRSWAFIAHS